MSDGKSVQSAAMSLAHEMGHGAQHLDGELDGKTRSQIEAANLRKYETPIAKQLGEPTRATYTSHKGKIKMNNSIHYRTTLRKNFKTHIISHNQYPIVGTSIGSAK